ncbi:MAG TPA: FAD-binding oxidoreductase [Desulfomonilia bacterium]
MGSKDIFKQIENYDEMLKDTAVLEKYGFDYQTRKGEVEKIIDELHPGRLNLVVSEIKEETPSTKSIRLVSADGYLPPFQAGQYINMFVDVGGIRTSRPYSIASAPTQSGYYEIAVRRVDDGFVSNYLLDELKVGALLQSSSPSGNFHYNPLYQGDNLVFIAGGSGITPFMSMIREMADRNTSRRVHMLYGSRVEGDVIYHDELKRIAAAHKNFSFDIVVSEPSEGYAGKKGFINAELIKDSTSSEDCTFFVCGPEAMYDFCLGELEKLSIPQRKIRVEIMGAPKDITLQPGWPAGVNAKDVFKVLIKGKKTIKARAGEPLMSSLERSGINIPALCRSGECSLCRTKLISGKVFQPDGVKLRKSDRRFGYIHPCMSYPLADIEIML